MQSTLCRTTLGACDDLHARANTLRPSRPVKGSLSVKCSKQVDTSSANTLGVSRRKAGVAILVGAASTMLTGGRQAAQAESIAKTIERSEKNLETEISTDLKVLYDLRVSREAEAYQRLEDLRIKGEAEARNERNQSLCATPFGVDVVGISQTVALIGALVGGISARNRKIELEELNDKLRNVNK
eukprot:1377052-Pyramimonas_sp.AAC.1